MAKASAENFVHLFERIAEPLGYGLRGGGGGQNDQMVYYYYDDETMMNTMIDSDMMKDTIKMVQGMMKDSAGRQNVKMLPVPPMPKKMPDLSLVKELCSKSDNFCYFLPNHRQAFSILKKIFMQTPNREELFKMACTCRDHPMVNNQLFVYALSSCLVSRPDTQDVPIPTHCEISPENYCNNDVVRQANKMSRMTEMISFATKSPPIKPPKVMIDKNLTGRGSDPEQRLWYFREDILVNSHHFHWHIVYPVCAPKDPKAPGYRDRRGELFYYMHHSMIARYDTERICNGLAKTRKFDFANLMIEEGYFGKLSSENSGSQWGTRQANTRLLNINTPDFQIKVEQLARWRDRILEVIDLGSYVEKDDKTGERKHKKLDEIRGIDILGNMIESSATLTPHKQLYGEAGFHNMGHVLIACSNDPKGKHKENVGVMGDVATAMRDPAFYRWHKYIDDLFDIYKQTLPPYPLDDDGSSKFPLRWKGIEVRSINVKAVDAQERNVLRTFWDYKEVDLSRGLDFRKSVMMGAKPTPVMGLFTHLNHSRFEYFIEIENKTGRQVLSTIRIFMGPRKDENGVELALKDQRLLLFEMDKVARTLTPGNNRIRISSTDSSVTLRDEDGNSFRNLEKLYLEAGSRRDVVKGAQCNCGWPQHLLLPKGSAGGTEYDVFVIVTDGSKDNLVQVNRKGGCNSALSFCGVLNSKYPDARPMGYPFDRLPYMVTAMEDNEYLNQCPEDKVPVGKLEKYVKDIPNSGMVKVTIYHDMTMRKAQEEMDEQVVGPDGKCIQLKDYYQGQMGDSGNRSPKEGMFGNVRPQPQQPQYGRPREPVTGSGRGNNRPRYPQGPAPEQWGGGGPRDGKAYGGGRKGRQDDNDEEWEHLDDDYGY